MAYVAISLIRVVMVGPVVGCVAGRDVAMGVADAAGTLVGNGVDVGNNASVAWAIGEQAAKPPSTPSAPTFNASLREIFLFMGIPLKSRQRVTY